MHSQFTNAFGGRSVETYALGFTTRTPHAFQSRTFHTRHASHRPSFVHPNNNGVEYKSWILEFSNGVRA